MSLHCHSTSVPKKGRPEVLRGKLRNINLGSHHHSLGFSAELRLAKQESESPKKQNRTQTFESEDEPHPESYLQTRRSQKSHETRNAERAFGKEKGQCSQKENLGRFLLAAPSHFAYSL
jgi:hypothetical protein